jgi:hypothetical protein
MIDDMLRRIYSESLGMKVDRKGLPSIKQYAKRIGWPEGALYRRALQLGIYRPRQRFWTDKELEILERNAANSISRIQSALERAGFQRTRHAIALKMWEMNFRLNRPYYSARSLGMALGFGNGDKVVSWVKKGLLYARVMDSEVEARKRDLLLIHEVDVRRFILKNPNLIDLRKVDQLWFFEIMFEGKAGMTVSDALQKEQPKKLYDEAEI